MDRIPLQPNQQAQKASGKFLTGTKAAAVRRRDSQGQPRLLVVGDPRVAVWEPPQSPFGLIEEELYDDPWRLLLACLLLNKTSGRQVASSTTCTSSLLEMSAWPMSQYLPMFAVLQLGVCGLSWQHAHHVLLFKCLPICWWKCIGLVMVARPL